MALIPSNRTPSAFFILSIVAFNFAIDRLTKIAAEVYLQGHGTFHVIGNYFILFFAHNKGAFLSMGSTMGAWMRLGLLAIAPTILLLGGLFILIKNRKRLDFIHRVIWATLIGGGLSNVYDRFFNDGQVVDFMNFGIGNLRTGILNVADLSITFSALALFILSLRKDKKALQIHRKAFY